MKMISRIYSKPTVQAMLRALRKTEGFTVTKISSGYEVKQLLPSRVVFKAMIGRNDYLVRHAEDLFTTTTK
jgi:hypothetical protein